MFSSFMSQKQEHSTELELLLCCARTQISTTAIDQIDTLLSSPLDWQFLTQIAIKHGLGQLVYQTLQVNYSAVVPPDVLNYLKNYSYQVAFQNTIFAKELFTLLEVFKQAGISILSFKGPVLAVSAYGNLGLRKFCDLDLLVSPDNFLDSFNLLVTQGYQPVYQWNFLNQDFEISLRQSKGEYALTNGRVCIDLHQRLSVEKFLSSRFTFDDLWNRRQAVSICGTTVDTFGTEDSLLYLCIHGSKDCWRRLKWICDISEFLHTHRSLDWSETLNRAEEMGCLRMLLLGLILAQSSSDVQLPTAVEQAIANNDVSQQLAHKFSQKLFAPDNDLNRKFTAEKFRLHLSMTETFKDRVACYLDIFRPIYAYTFLKLLPTQKDKDFLLLPRPLYFLYYLVRPIRLVWKQVATLT